ncbi:MAG: substrate-binding domain-containing protein, partial [Planctomycetota bacterium]|nr:substrate-binding domain-containing protein [Planctomycetota bacterium]
WKGKYGEEPIVREENLALSPMVFAMWKERGDAFVAKYKEASFQTLGEALAEKGGWNAIAQKPEWGLFKLGHTHPNESNSGLITLVMMSYSYHKKSKALEMKDILDTGFQTWMQEFERGVSGLSNSTGNMMKEMVLKGPSSYDALVVYENVVIDYLKSAQGRWGDLHVYYPRLNMWNENPYYVLGASWSSKEQRGAAGIFLDFLMSEPIQRKALDHGFRPGNPSIAINQADSPFVMYKKNGLQIDIDTVCEPPRSEVVNNLLAAWQRSQGRR